MKLRETEFIQQITAVIAGLILIVASVAFVSIPAVLAGHPGESVQGGAPAPDWHPT